MRVVPALTAFAIAAIALVPRASRADECEDDHLKAQEDRSGRHLVEAREELLRCAASTCPNLVQADCVKWLEEVNADIPTVVPAARSAEGRDLRDVRVRLDGKPWLSSLDGTAVPVDPGEHTLRFEREGAEPVDVPVLARMGAKNEPATATFKAPAGPLARPRAATIAAWSLVGVGGAAILAFAALEASGEIQYHHLKTTCAPGCPPSEVDSVRSEFIAGDVLGALGAACLGSALIVYLAVPPRREAAEPPAALVIEPTVAGAAATLSIPW